ncbi:MAG: tryptophan synthase beta chain [Chloroflexota bacterium]|jgi:tryptophan synthase beta chain|nr:tryptophan synthase beta chain [Chloroflexota bacterium]
MTATRDRIPSPARTQGSAASTAPRASRVLDEIASRRKADVERELAGTTLHELARAAAAGPEPRDQLGRLLRPGLHLIAEIKRRSPSAGTLGDEHLDVAGRARAYAAGGASAISVLVEPHWFGGSLDDLRAARDATSLPVLAKEFVVDPRQLLLLRAAGADLVLLLAALHPRARLARLVAQARDLALEPLVEAHDERELDAAVSSGARVVGINNRNLRTLVVDPELAERLRRLVPDDLLVVAESGVRDERILRRWRAQGFDAALVGEELMRAGSDAASVRARTAALVEAGRPPSAAEDPTAADRAPFVKICGITEPRGLRAAIASGADAIGLNLVPGTKRALTEEEATKLARLCREIGGAGAGPTIVGVFADRDPAEVDAMARRIGLDAVQLSGAEAPDALDAIALPVAKVLHLSDAVGPDEAAAAVASTVERARAFQGKPNLWRLLLDTQDATVAGGTGRRVPVNVARLVARQVPVTLAGGLNPENVAEALREVPATGVDVAGGVEPLGDVVGRPAKDPFRVGLFVKRARAARTDLPTVESRPHRVDHSLVEPDPRGRWGRERQFGGRFVPETLISALLDLEAAYVELRQQPHFWAELRELGRRFVGRPTPVYRADRLAAELERRAGRDPGGLRLYVKREDLAHTGAHKINNALGQSLLTRRLGKSRVIAETGAGQHGVATATACALLDLECVVYMGAEDIKRQAPNVLRMRALGTEVREVTAGSATLKDAINEAMRDWVTNVATTHYVLGSAVGPHPYPALVRDLQRVIGDEAAAQVVAAEGRLPDVAIACVGGGSNAIGLLSRFIGEPEVRLIGVEAAGEGLTARHAAALAGGSPGVLHGSRSYLLQDADGQVQEAHSISAGLDYPGIGPQLSALYDAGRLEILSATDEEALDGVRTLTRSEGILPALEPAHAIAALGAWLAGTTLLAELPDRSVVLLGLSGRGDKDIASIADRLEAHGH